MRIFIRAVIACLLVGSLWGAILFLDGKGYFQMEDFNIEVTGEHIDPIYLAPYLKNIESRLVIYKGKSLLDLPLSSLSESFEHEEWVKTVSIVRRWPNRIHVSITPKSVVLAYLNAGGQAQLIDDNGELIGSVNTSNMPDVTIARGAEIENDPSIRKKAVELLDQLPSSGTLSKKSVSTISYEKDRGFWLSLIDSGLEIRMGQGDFEKKSKRVSQVLRYMDANQYQGRLIDANFSRKVLVRIKNN